MTTIGFYKIAGSKEDALIFACQLTEKAFRKNMAVLLQVADSQQAEALSQRLWSFSPAAFLPHTLDSFSPVTINCNTDPAAEHHGFLINLTGEIPGWFSRFERAAEIVYDDHQVIEKKREHFKFYKERGYPIQYHDLRSTGGNT